MAQAGPRPVEPFQCVRKLGGSLTAESDDPKVLGLGIVLGLSSLAAQFPRLRMGHRGVAQAGPRPAGLVECGRNVGSS